MGTRDHQGAPCQRTAQVSHSRGEDLHRRLQEGNLLQIRHPTKFDLSLEKVSTDAGVRLRNLKRRRGFDANILPQKRPALSVAERVAKVDNVALLEMIVMLFCTCLAHTQLCCTNTCTLHISGPRQGARVPEICLLFTARTNCSQVRQQEDDAKREDRLADQRHRQAVVRFVVVVVVIDTGTMVGVFDDWQGHIFSGSRSRR